MLRPYCAGITLGLNKPSRVADGDLPIHAPVAGITTVAGDRMTAAPEGLEQQLFEGQGIHRPQSGIDQTRRLRTISSAQLGAHRSGLAPPPSMPDRNMEGAGDQSGRDQSQCNQSDKHRISYLSGPSLWSG